VEAGEDKDEGEADGAVLKVEKKRNKMSGNNKSPVRYLRERPKNIVDPVTVCSCSLPSLSLTITDWG
jgi:hypothetical protein